ncbi:MAG TPA: PQQ-binding-like beta-propeller repeat protein [Streptosporangiaceae bacterium]
MGHRWGAAAGALLTGLAVGVSACTTGAGGAGVRHGHGVRAGTAANWPAHHANAARTGVARGLPAAGDLAVGWSRRLDGAVYGQPLVIDGMVIAATEQDSVYGLGLTTGQVRWRVRVAAPLPQAGQPCGNINPLGITSTPVYYRGLVWVLAQDGRSGHLLVGLLPHSGRVRYRRAVPSPDGRPYYDQQRGALAAGNGRIYVTFGGHAGDCGPYVGSVVGMPAGRPGPRAIVSYLVPTTRHGGIWAPGGPVISGNGTVYVGIGNGRTSPPFDGTDSVTALSPDLHRIGVFAPADWAADNKGDLDLGSMTPALTPAGQVLIVGKRGTGYLLSTRHLGGVGSEVARHPVCPAFGAAAVLGGTVILPCSGGGPAAVLVAQDKLRVLWRGPSGADGSPVIGGRAVWVTANSAGVLYELSPRTGQVQHKIRLGSPLPHFASPSLSGNLVLIGTMHGVVAITGA